MALASQTETVKGLRLALTLNGGAKVAWRKKNCETVVKWVETMLPGGKRIKTVKLAKKSHLAIKFLNSTKLRRPWLERSYLQICIFLLQLSILLKYVFYSKYVFYLNMYFTPRKLEINVVLMVNLWKTTSICLELRLWNFFLKSLRVTNPSRSESRRLNAACTFKRTRFPT